MKFEDIVVGHTYTMGQLLATEIGNSRNYYNSPTFELDVNTVFGPKTVYLDIRNSGYARQFHDLAGDFPFRVLTKVSPSHDVIGEIRTLYCGTDDITRYFNFDYLIDTSPDVAVIATVAPAKSKQVFHLSPDRSTMTSSCNSYETPQHVLDYLSLIEKNGGVLVK